MRVLRILLFALFFFVLAPIAMPWVKSVFVRDPVPPEWILDFDGFGPLQVGMTRLETLAALDYPFDEISLANPDDCSQLLPKRPGNRHGVESPVFMMTDGRLRRFEIYRKPWQTVHGLRVGDDAVVLSSGQLGKPEVAPNHYDENLVEYVFFSVGPDHERYSMLYEVDRSGRITHIRSGRAAEVSLIEGCL